MRFLILLQDSNTYDNGYSIGYAIGKFLPLIFIIVIGYFIFKLVKKKSKK